MHKGRSLIKRSLSHRKLGGGKALSFAKIYGSASIQLKESGILSSDILILNGDIASKALACALSISDYFKTTSENIEAYHYPLTLLDWDSHPEATTEPTFTTTLDPLLLSPTTMRFLNSLGVL